MDVIIHLFLWIIFLWPVLMGVLVYIIVKSLLGG